MLSGQKYHPDCQSIFSKNPPRLRSESVTSQRQMMEAHNEAFKVVLDSVKSELIMLNEVTQLSYLTYKY